MWYPPRCHWEPCLLGDKDWGFCPPAQRQITWHILLSMIQLYERGQCLGERVSKEFVDMIELHKGVLGPVSTPKLPITRSKIMMISISGPLPLTLSAFAMLLRRSPCGHIFSWTTSVYPPPFGTFHTNSSPIISFRFSDSLNPVP